MVEQKRAANDAQKTNDQWPPAHGLPDQRRYKNAATLRWGETPFDDLDRGELLRLVQAYHAVAVHARVALVQLRQDMENNPYWGADGTGGGAVDGLEYLVKRAGDIETNPDRDNIHRCFFRSAYGLLFPETAGEFDRWGIDEATGQMVSPFIPGEASPLRQGRSLRAIEWKDLLPKQPEAGNGEQAE